MTGTAGIEVDFIVILVERRGHYHLDEINKKISIFLPEKLFEESIFLPEKLFEESIFPPEKLFEESIFPV